MNRQEIQIAIGPDGRVEYTIVGVKGPACADLSALLERLGEVEHEERTGEYYQEDGDGHIHISR